MPLFLGLCVAGHWGHGGLGAEGLLQPAASRGGRPPAHLLHLLQPAQAALLLQALSAAGQAALRSPLALRL